MGDAILKVAVAEPWFLRGETRARWTEMKQKVVCNANLNACGQRTELGRLLYPGNGVFPVAPLVMSVAVQAVLGAVWLDCHDLDKVKAVVEQMGLLDVLG